MKGLYHVSYMAHFHLHDAFQEYYAPRFKFFASNTIIEM